MPLIEMVPLSPASYRKQLANPNPIKIVELVAHKFTEPRFVICNVINAVFCTWSLQLLEKSRTPPETYGCSIRFYVILQKLAQQL